MVTVAKNFDAPIKMLFPRNIFTWIKSGLLTTKGLEFSMLGLGDIAIPGVYVALCARFDHYLAVKKNGGKPIKKFPMPYFTSCYISYILGLITTMGVMHVFNHAQVCLLLLYILYIYTIYILYILILFKYLNIFFFLNCNFFFYYCYF